MLYWSLNYWTSWHAGSIKIDASLLVDLSIENVLFNLPMRIVGWLHTKKTELEINCRRNK